MAIGHHNLRAAAEALDDAASEFVSQTALHGCILDLHRAVAMLESVRQLSLELIEYCDDKTRGDEFDESQSNPTP